MNDDKVLNQALLGSVNYRTTSNHPRAPIELLDDSITANLGAVTVPQLQGKPHHGHAEPFDGTMALHRQAHEHLLAAFAELEADGLLDRILSVGESFAARLQSTVGGVPTPYLSTHALGLAFDLNPEQNVIGDPATIKEDHPGGLRGLMTVFARHGLRWGGLDQPINASHFEVTTFLALGETLPTMAVVCLGDQPRGDIAAALMDEEYWADAVPLSRLLGGQARLPEPLAPGPGPFPVEVALGGGSRTLDGRRRGSAMMVKLDEVLALTNRHAEPQPGREQVRIAS